MFSASSAAKILPEGAAPYGLDFIPVVIITNGGLTEETEGISDVKELWDNQDAYNKLTSDDIVLHSKINKIGICMGK